MPLPTLLKHFDTTELLTHVRNRLQALNTAREPCMQFWRLIAEDLYPAKLQYLLDPTSRSKAGEFNEHICDAVGHLSLNTSTGGVVSGAMPQTSQWFGLKVRGTSDENDEEQRFLDDAASKLLDLHNQSNASHVMPECIKEWLSFGVGAALYLDDEEHLFRIEPLTVGEYWIADDHHGFVDTLYRKLVMTVAQLEQEFGFERMTTSSQAAYKDKRYDDPVTVVHAIEPDRDNRNPIRSAALPWRSVYFEEAGDAKGGQVLAVRGFHRFPGMVWRYGKLSGSAYSYGLGADVLPHLVRLRRLIYRYGQALALKADPPLQMPAGMSQHEVKALPGGKSTYFGTQEIKAIYKHELELREVAEQIAQTKADIRECIGATQVVSLRRITQAMTKGEAEIRKSEDLAEFLPGLMRLHKELLSPYVEQMWDSAEYFDQLGRVPMSFLQGGARKVDVVFTSPLARAQRQGEADAIVRTVAVCAEMMKIDPSVRDNLDLDTALRTIADIEGAPSRILVPLERMRQMREAQANQQLAEKQSMAMQQGVELARGAAEAQSLAGAAA